MKVYRLLRNNQETGPFTAEEILQKGLKPYDLIWVDGKSAAWRYPSEVEAFRHYVVPVEEQPYDRFYKKTEGEENKPATKPVVKPKFRIRADSHKIELIEPEVIPIPQYEEVAVAKKNTPVQPAPVPVVETTAPAWQEALTDWQEKQPASQPAKPERIEVKRETPIQFPPSSPEELDETYKESFFRTKPNNNRGKQILSYAVLGILAPLLIAGMWFGFRQENKQELPATTVAVTENKDQQTNATSSVSKETNPLIENKEKEQAVVTPPPQTPVQVTQPEAQPVHTEQQNAAIPATKHVVENATVQPAKEKQKPITNTATVAAPVVKQPAAAVVQNKKPVVQQPVAPAAVKTTPPQQSASAKPKVDIPVMDDPSPATTTAANNPPPITATKGIGSYVDVQQENLPAAPGEKSVRFHVKNLGDAQVDLVVLDLQYFDGRGKLRKGSTMYFKKIPAQNDIAVDAPIVKDADRVSYKVSLLSIEQKGVYIIAE